jgi:COMPASS component BRE2
MADAQTPSRSGTPSIAPPIRRPLEEDHTPAVSSPLNPDSAARSRPVKPVQREQREKRETLKKREASGNVTRGGTPDVKGKEKKAPIASSPMRYTIPEPKPADYEPPKDPTFASNELHPMTTPDGTTELKKPVEM